eukprot:scpid39427/ scgid2978/ 
MIQQLPTTVALQLRRRFLPQRCSLHAYFTCVCILIYRLTFATSTGYTLCLLLKIALNRALALWMSTLHFSFPQSESIVENTTNFVKTNCKGKFDSEIEESGDVHVTTLVYSRDFVEPSSVRCYDFHTWATVTVLGPSGGLALHALALL